MVASFLRPVATVRCSSSQSETTSISFNHQLLNITTTPSNSRSNNTNTSSLLETNSRNKKEED
jgi:hypothetical protein